MISRLQLLRNVGLFDSVSGAANIPLARLTLIHAENGRGKTTLAAILRSLATGNAIPIVERKRLASQHDPHVVLDCDGGPPAAIFQNGAWNRIVPNMSVFDDVFVDDNVYSGLAVDPQHRQNLHELILGAEGIALNRALQSLAKTIDVHNAALKTKEAAIPPAERGTMLVDDFCALPARADIDTAILAAERNLAAAGEQEPIWNTAVLETLSLPAFDAGKINALLQRDLPNLEASAAARVQAHVSGIGSGGEAWVADGMRRTAPPTPDGAAGACPFCAQDLGGSPVINPYRAYFSTAYADLKREIAGALAEVHRLHEADAPAAFERAVRVTSESRQFWSRFCDVPELSLDTAAIAQAWRTAHEAVSAALQAKQASPLERTALGDAATGAIAAFDTHRARVSALNQGLQQANTLIGAVKAGAAAGSVATATDALARLRAVKARHAPATAALCAAYLQEKTGKTGTETNREEAKKALNQYRETAFPKYQTAVNKYLGKFNAGFTLGSVTGANPKGGPTCTYSVVINNTQVQIAGGTPVSGTPSFKNTLSSGDRNTLALAFFFASLDPDPTLPPDPTLADKIVVIDDPMTSLDEHRTLTTVQEVRTLSTRACQVIVLSHDKPFLCGVWEGASKKACAALSVVRDPTGSTIAAWKVSDDCVTEYDRQHARLRDYLRANTGNRRQVAQDLRHVLEGFLRRACAEHFRPGEVLGKLRTRIRDRQPADPEILPANAVEELEAISEYANKFHHETNQGWETEAINDSELRSWVQRTLDFAKKSANS